MCLFQVKTLEWSGDGVRLLAQSVLGYYIIEQHGREWAMTAFGETDYFETEAKAKEAAQADFERRILSAIVFKGNTDV